MTPRTLTPTVERAALVGLVTGADHRSDPELMLEELAGLADAAGATVVLRAVQERPTPDPATLIGSGKAEALARACDDARVSVVIVDNDLSPAQLRNLERILRRRVIDRTQLILDIFARRARTREGKLQVELAQLQYLMPRLVGSSEALSRLGGGIGTRGPGETKLETDRRRIRHRIAGLKADIADVQRRRGHLRARRTRRDVPTVALVGYTNAGKTTLFNALTGGDAVASDALFVTLDPLVRRVKLPDARQILMSDTVGFIDRLPHQLVAAFHATLEEVASANLLLHVADASAPDRDRRDQAVRSVLESVGAGDVPTLMVFNKIDLLPADEVARLKAMYPSAVFVSALHGHGQRDLLDIVASRLEMDTTHARIEFDPDSLEHRRAIADLYRHARVTGHVAGDASVVIDADVPRRLLDRLARVARVSIGAALVVGLMLAGACTSKRPPVNPAAATVEWHQPDVPAALAGAAARARYDEAWTKIARGDTSGGEKILLDIQRRDPSFYPAETSIGQLRFQQRQFAAAAAMFDRVAAAHPSYVPALSGAVDAHLAAGDDPGAVRALHALAAADPKNASVRARLEAVRLRVAQSELALADRARVEGKFDEAQLHIGRALEATPESGAVVRAWSALELAMGHPDQAERRAREALIIDAQDAQSYVALADALVAESRPSDAVEALDRALAIEPRPAWVERRRSLAAAAGVSAMPPQYQAIGRATQVTRAQVAALLGVRLSGVLGSAPDRVTAVVTDVRGQWAERWILPVVRAGWIDALPNHTFQPNGVVRRAELAAILSAVVADAAAGRPRDVAKWRSARPVFADITRDHAAYGVAALVVSAGIMTTEASRFAPARVVTGPELTAAVARLEQLAK